MYSLLITFLLLFVTSEKTREKTPVSRKQMYTKISSTASITNTITCDWIFGNRSGIFDYVGVEFQLTAWNVVINKTALSSRLR